MKLEWGTANNQLGHRRPQEGSPEGPMSFEVDASGRVFVLDQVNSRIQVFQDGRAPRSIPLPSDTFCDIAADEDGRLAVLDRQAGDELLILDESGRVESQLQLSGKEIPEGGLVTALFSRTDGTWVEVNNEKLVRVADEDGLYA